MKEQLLTLLESKKGANDKFNTMREYLQAYALRVMYDEGIFRSTAFMGGTALRFLYGLPRYSEALDFSSAKGTGPLFLPLMKKMKTEFDSAGYTVSIKTDDQKNVRSAFIKFEGLMHEVNLSGHADQKFSIKIEIDVNPPDGASYETQVVNKYFPIAFLSYDRPSLFAGKIHALLSRRYTKGRDYFDLGWYLSRWKSLVPNLKLLQNALTQTGWKGEKPNEKNWRELLSRVLQAADWKKVKRDVENFLERPGDLEIFTKENVFKLVNG